MIVTYIIAAVEHYDGWAKIGQTTHIDAGSRLRTCQTANPRALTIVASWPADAEKPLHRYYASVRGRGEWFALPSSMLTFATLVSGHEKGHVHLMVEWPADRIWRLAPEGITAPDDLADTLSGHLTAHGPHTQAREAA